MVAPTRTSSEYWRRHLEALYSALEGLDVSGYAWHDSDGWTQSRTPGEWRAHLEVWLDLGGAMTLALPYYRHDCRAVFALRYHADDDSMSQARMQAAIRDAAETLMTTRLPDGARVVQVDNIAVEGPYAGGFVQVTILFTALFPR